ncbi:unnamed protein product, partial [Symbiodinium necroappetens]
MNGAELAGGLLTALGKLDMEPYLWQADAYPHCHQCDQLQSSFRAALAAPLAVGVSDPPRLTQVRDKALVATKADVKGYNDKQVVSWLVVTSLSGMNGPGLVMASEITFADIAQDAKYAEHVFDGVWVYNLLTRLPCGYIPDAQQLGNVSLGDGPQKRCIPVLFGESGSGKTVQALFAPALKMLTEDCGVVRVFACSLPDASEHLDKVREASRENRTAVRAEWCQKFVMQEFKERLKNAFPNHGDLVRGWLEDEQRNSSALGSVVFVIDEITKCPELAKGIAACQDDIYKELNLYCDSPQLVMASTSAARVLEPGPSLDYSSDPSKVCLVPVGQVKERSFLDSLIA